MKRILKSIVERIYMVTACVACPPIVVNAYHRKKEEKRLREPVLLPYTRVIRNDKGEIIYADHEKPTPNHYATYLCIDSNSK